MSVLAGLSRRSLFVRLVIIPPLCFVIWQVDQWAGKLENLDGSENGMGWLELDGLRGSRVVGRINHRDL